MRDEVFVEVPFKDPPRYLVVTFEGIVVRAKAYRPHRSVATCIAAGRCIVLKGPIGQIMAIRGTSLAVTSNHFGRFR